MSNHKGTKLLDEVRKVMRVKHYSIHTERTYCDWIKRFVQFHHMTGRDDLLTDQESKIEDFFNCSGREIKCGGFHPEPGNECTGISLQAGPRPAIGKTY